jgi:hypothetical protein
MRRSAGLFVVTCREVAGCRLCVVGRKTTLERCRRIRRVAEVHALIGVLVARGFDGIVVDSSC